MTDKLKIGVYGISGCAGCLLSILFEDCFKQLVELVDIKAFPLIKAEDYEGEFDYVFIEGTVCFDEDIEAIKKLREKSKFIVALGACSCTGGVPSIKNFLDSEKTMKLVYPVFNHLRAEPPTPIDQHIKVDYYIPQCPPNKEEVVEFVKCIATGREFKPYREPVCFECRRIGNPCLLDKGDICLGPITNGGCKALCPSNSVTCYGCRGPSKDANFNAFSEMLKQMGYTKIEMHDKMKTFSGLQFKEVSPDKTTWLEE
ncbi:MAG: Ni/Fe hydrogenase subunit delta [Nanoarchaeota archaeon]|nr:Ni/Fe hydrogenase subunit delta [Nanoarchaeota archaeon]